MALLSLLNLTFTLDGMSGIEAVFTGHETVSMKDSLQAPRNWGLH